MPEAASPAPAQDVSAPEPSHVPAAPVEALSGPEIACDGETVAEPVAADGDDPLAALLLRVAELQARLAALPDETATPAPAAPRVTVSATIDMPPIPAARDNVIPLPRDPRAIAAARARLAIESERPRRSAAHERAIRRAWAERKARSHLAMQMQWGQIQFDAAQDEIKALQDKLAMAEAERLRVADLARDARAKRRRAVLSARGRLSRLRAVASNHRQHAGALSAELAKLKRDLADPCQPERASDIAQLVRDRDTTRTALAASQARCERQGAAIVQLAERFEEVVSRVARAEAAIRRPIAA